MRRALFLRHLTTKKLLWEEEIKKLKKEKRSKALLENQDQRVKKRLQAINLRLKKKVKQVHKFTSSKVMNQY